MSFMLGTIKRSGIFGGYGHYPLHSLNFEKLCLADKFTDDSSDSEIDDVDTTPSTMAPGFGKVSQNDGPLQLKKMCGSSSMEIDERSPPAQVLSSVEVVTEPIFAADADEDQVHALIPFGSQYIPEPVYLTPEVMQIRTPDPVVSQYDIGELIRDLENVYKVNRASVVTSENLTVSTPMHALKFLCNRFGEELNASTYLLPPTPTRPLKYRVELYVGVFRGVGEAKFKRIAAQMAALDLLLRIDAAMECPGILPFALLPGWRVSARVFQAAEEFCKKNGLQEPRYLVKSNVGDDSKPPTRVELWIGKKRLGIGESETPDMAKKLAAKDFLESLTQIEYEEEEVAMGSMCTPYSQLVKENLSLHMTPAKMRWLFEMSGRGGLSDQIRGVDEDERAAISDQITRSELLKLERKEISMKITLDGRGQRNVSLDESHATGSECNLLPERGPSGSG